MKNYGVPVSNRFAQLDSESELEGPAKQPGNLALQPSPPARAPVAAVAPARPAGRGKPEAVPEVRPERRPRAEGEGEQRGGRRGGFRGGLASRLDGGDDNIADGRGSGYRRGNPRHDRGGRGAAFRGREYERHSGTGRGREMKKSGAGGFNWGPTDNAAEEEAAVEKQGEVPSDLERLPSSEPGTPVEEAGLPSELASPEEKYVDFTEWQKSQREMRAQMVKPAEASRLVDTSALEGYQRYEKEEDEKARVARDKHEGEEGSAEGSLRPRTYNIYDFTGDYGKRGGRRENGRGGRGSRAERVAARPAAAPQMVLDLRDTAAFPSLG